MRRRLRFSSSLHSVFSLRTAAWAAAAVLLAQPGPASAQADEALAAPVVELAPPPLDLPSLAGNWHLVAVLGNTANDLAAQAIVGAQATAHFHVLFDSPVELHATFVGPPLSQTGGVAGGSLVLDDPSRGTLKLTSQQPTATTTLLRELDAGLLPDAFVVGQGKGESQFLYVRDDVETRDAVDALVQRASARSGLVATLVQ